MCAVRTVVFGLMVSSLFSYVVRAPGYRYVFSTRPFWRFRGGSQTSNVSNTVLPIDICQKTVSRHATNAYRRGPRDRTPTGRRSGAQSDFGGAFVRWKSARVTKPTYWWLGDRGALLRGASHVAVPLLCRVPFDSVRRGCVIACG